MPLPITIIVDELDRCRPTYAIKVLEEIKHLFDVPGVAFLLGLHGQQLEHSVRAAYGQGFDSAAYLRRFFNRRYSLKSVSLEPLIAHLIGLLGINESLLVHPPILRQDAHQPENLPNNELISDYLRAYDLAARDAFSIMEGLQTSMALVENRSVDFSYLLPLIVSNHLGATDLQQSLFVPKWKFAIGRDGFERGPKGVQFDDYIKGIHAAAQMSDRQIIKATENGNAFAHRVAQFGFQNLSTARSKQYYLLQNYRDLIKVLSRFS